MDYYTLDNDPDLKLGEYPPAAFYFKVVITGRSGKLDSDVSFQDVSGISREMETEDVAEGGENGFAYRLPKAVKYQKLVLKRGIAPKSSALVEWCRKVLEGGLAEPIVPGNVQVMLMNAKGSAIRTWNFKHAYPVKWAVDNFNSEKNAVAIETIELTYSEFSREN